MNRVLNQFVSLQHKIVQTYMATPHPTEKYIRQLTDKQLLDTQLVKQILSKQIPKHTITSQYGLWHGLQPKTGNQTCFSEKKSRRSWMPNVQQKTFYSDVLEREIHTRVTTKALKCIRKLGSFDNYILLTKAKNLDSTYGEYLRRLMIGKINNPDLQIPTVAKARPHDYSRRAQRFSKLPVPVWHPPEIRHTDLSHMNVKVPQNMNPRELRKVRVLEELQLKFEDIESNHPLLTEEFAEDEEFNEMARRDGDAAMEKFMNKKNKEKVRLTLQAVEDNYQEGIIDG